MLLDRVDGLINEHSMTRAELERKIGLSAGSIRNWNKSIPSGDKLKKVADFFNVTTDYLLGREENTKKRLDLDDDTVIMTYQGKPLSPEDRELILRLMRGK